MSTAGGRRPRRATQRAFTLIELIVTLVVASIVVAAITQVVYNQQRAFYDQLHYAEAQQNARASISLLERFVRLAGWGMPGDPNLLGITPIGACYLDSMPERQQLACDGVDQDAELQSGAYPKGTDRLRVNYIMPEGGGVVTAQPFTATSNSAQVGPRQDSGGNALASPAGHGFSGNDIAMIAGACVGGGSAADLLQIVDFTAGVTSYFNYTFTNVADGSTNYSCAGNYDTGYTFGKAMVADFWVDHVTNPRHPTLKLRLDPTLALSSAYVVAYDIDDLQVRFLIDTTCATCTLATTPDNIWDEACDNVMSNDTTVGGCGDAYSARQRLARTVAAEVAVVTRTRDPDDRFDNVSMVVQNHQYTAFDYRRWIYRATVSTRNNDL